MGQTVMTSPLNCAWIGRSTVGSVEGITYGVCRRIRDAERVVSEIECEFCPWWEPPLSGADARIGVPLNAPQAREAPWGRPHGLFPVYSKTKRPEPTRSDT